MSRPPGSPTEELPRIAKYLGHQIEAMKDTLNQREIAKALGYSHGTIVSMFKTGTVKVPLDKIPALAEVLRVDVVHLMQLGLEQYFPGKMAEISAMFANVVSDSEMEIIEVIRKSTEDSDTKVTAAQKTAIRTLFAKK